MGARKLLSALSRKYILPNGISACERAVQGCHSCMQRKPPQKKLGKMRSTPPSTPWSTVALDFCGPYPTSESGMRYVLVITDQFTKWVELIPTKDQLSLTVVQVFYERIICRHGCPLRVLSDNGPQFRSALVALLCQYFGMQKIFSSAYYPQGDGYAERMMRTLNNSLASL
ncbi:KRAB-A domain protein, partial [Gregarina niphandrodes]